MAAFNDILIRIITTPRKWTWQNVIGTVLLVMGYALPRVVTVSPELSNLCDQAYFVGGILGLFGAAAPLPGVKPSVEVSRGFGRVAVLVALACAGLALALMSGCASAERNGSELTFVVRDDPANPWPACLYESTLDGKPLLRGAVGDCSKIPACWKVER